MYVPSYRALLSSIHIATAIINLHLIGLLILMFVCEYACVCVSVHVCVCVCLMNELF